MAFDFKKGFWAKKKVETTEEKLTPKKAIPQVISQKAETGVPPQSHFDVLLRPHITEKATMLSEGGIYVFDVARDATKAHVAKAVKTLFSVTPKKIRIVNRAPRAMFSRVRRRGGVKPGLKKAYIQLKKGDRIEFV